MKKVIIGSTNPVKVDAARMAFEKVFEEKYEFAGVSVESGVSDQPMSSQETLIGAKNRAMKCREQEPDADYFIGMEGGVDLVDSDLLAFAWMAILDKSGKMSTSRTGHFILPPEVKRLIVEEGKELGDADDIVFGRSNSKQKEGGIGLMTKGAISRKDFYHYAIITALIPFLNKELY